MVLDPWEVPGSRRLECPTGVLRLLKDCSEGSYDLHPWWPGLCSGIKFGSLSRGPLSEGPWARYESRANRVRVLFHSGTCPTPSRGGPCLGTGGASGPTEVFTHQEEARLGRPSEVCYTLGSSGGGAVEILQGVGSTDTRQHGTLSSGEFLGLSCCHVPDFERSSSPMHDNRFY